MQLLPKIGNLFEISQKGTLILKQDIRSNKNVLFEKSVKGYILKISDSQPFKMQIRSHKASQVHFQLYMLDKLKMTLELERRGEAIKLIVSPTGDIYQKIANEVRLSSAFVLTKKWISLCFDIQSFFGSQDYNLKGVEIASNCKIRKIYESPDILQVNDGLFLVQRISERRINELLPVSLRAQSQKLKTFRRQSTEDSIQEQRISVPIKRVLRNIKKPSHHALLEKTVKMATGLQMIEEVGRPPLYQIKQNVSLQKKAVHSFLRHTQEFKDYNKLGMATPPDTDSDHIRSSQFSNFTRETEYQTKYGKFSSTFSKPLGVSSYHNKLISQQSLQQNSQEYFYISSDHDIQQKEAEIEENIESHHVSEDSITSLPRNIKQEDDSEDLAVSEFQ